MRCLRRILQGRWHAAGSVRCFQQVSLSGSLPMDASRAQAWYNIGPMKNLLEKATHIRLLIPDVKRRTDRQQPGTAFPGAGTIVGSNESNG